MDLRHTSVVEFFRRELAGKYLRPEEETELRPGRWNWAPAKSPSWHGSRHCYGIITPATAGQRIYEMSR